MMKARDPVGSLVPASCWRPQGMPRVARGCWEPRHASPCSGPAVAAPVAHDPAKAGESVLLVLERTAQ